MDTRVADLPEVTEPLDELRRVVLVELDVREIHLEDRRTRVAHVEEHQLGFTQVHRRQSAGVRTVKVHALGVTVTLHVRDIREDYRSISNALPE